MRKKRKNMKLKLKQSRLLITLLYLELCFITQATDICSTGDSEAHKFFERENELLLQRYREEALANYEYKTNVTKANRLNSIAAEVRRVAGNKKLSQVIRDLGYDHIDDPCLRRQANILADFGFSILNAEDYDDLQNTINKMQTHHENTKACSYKNSGDCSLTLNSLKEILSQSRDPKELAHYWQEWHDKASTPLKETFAKYVELTRKAANLNHYSSHADYWIHFYEDPNFEEHLDEAFETILPLYREIHAYVRYRLNQYYGNDIIPQKGNIPIHLLGNMWANNWQEIIELVKPYPNISFIDITSAMARNGITVKKMFELGDDFFKSLGMHALPDSFWNLSILEKPEDRVIKCGRGSARNLYGNSDVRIIMCTKVDAYNLYTLHHMLGRIQYFLQFEQQPTAFRMAPNPGFRRGSADSIVLSASSIRHLNAIGLSTVAELDDESRINELLKMALDKVIMIPFAYSTDKFRYAIFRNEIDISLWNCAFWQLRSRYIGVEPAVTRSENDFDPTSERHIVGDIQYIKKFVSHILQFQFHKAMCLKAGQYVKGDVHKTLDNCDIYGSKEAGEAFSRMLSAGASRHWSDLLYEFTGDKQINPSALLEYFEPLYKWLKEENRKLNIPIGWDITEKIPNSCSVKSRT